MKLAKALITLAIVAALCVQVAIGHLFQAFVLASAAAAVLHGFNAEKREWSFVNANTLTDLIPSVYKALDVVSREIVGFIPSVARDASADRCALNATLRSIVAPANTAGTNITPAMSLPAAADQVIGNKTFAITKARAFPFSWNGEEQYSVDSGPGYLTIEEDQIAQAIRAAVNEIEVDISVAAALAGSRAYGTAGTTPFASDLSDTANINKLLTDNGAPLSGRSLIINTTAGAKMRTLAQLTKANEAGTTMTLRDGELLNVHSLSIKESAQIQTPTVGTGAAFQLNGAHAAGATTIAVDTGTGTILAGDIVTINSVKYVVKTALSAGSFTIGAPGLLTALADNVAVAVNAAAARNIAFTQNAILLGTRLPALPKKGDLALDRTTITDSRSGLSFELAYYPGFRMGVYHISIAWGVSVLKDEHLVQLLG